MEGVEENWWEEEEDEEEEAAAAWDVKGVKGYHEARTVRLEGVMGVGLILNHV